MQKFPLPELYKNPKSLLDAYKTVAERQWLEQGELNAYKLFYSMASSVPAYQKFMKSNSIDPAKFSSLPSTSEVPSIDKDSYLRPNKRADLVWDSEFKSQAWLISATSGSTGVPYYFPRTNLQDQIYAIMAEVYLNQNFDISSKSTLYVNAFPMGVWIGGVFTFNAVNMVAQKGYPLSLITPGINKLEVISAIKNLSADFDQIIIGSYAPFLKDIIDDGQTAGVNWQELDVKFIFSAEAFSEDFRDYLQAKVGLKNIYSDTLNHYGTVDLGTMAHETPLSILIRRLSLKNPQIYQELFSGSSKLPTLCQYDPNLFYFEQQNGNLYCSSYSGIPLFRYDLKDRGGILNRHQIDDIFAKHGIDLQSEIDQAGLSDQVWNLPFVYVFERSDFSVSFYAFQVYPEVIRKALLKDDLANKLTGKFTMLVEYDPSGAQQLKINTELSATSKASAELEQQVQQAVTQQLLTENSEYRKTSEEIGIDRIKPQIILWPYESAEYFKPGGKQKWVKK